MASDGQMLTQAVPPLARSILKRRWLGWGDDPIVWETCLMVFSPWNMRKNYHPQRGSKHQQMGMFQHFYRRDCYASNIRYEPATLGDSGILTIKQGVSTALSLDSLFTTKVDRPSWFDIMILVFFAGSSPKMPTKMEFNGVLQTRGNLIKNCPSKARKSRVFASLSSPELLVAWGPKNSSNTRHYRLISPMLLVFVGHVLFWN